MASTTHRSAPGKARPSRRRIRRLGLILLAVLGVGALGTPTVAAAATPSASGVAYPPGSHPRGADLTTWTERWWAWALGQPLDVNPNLGADTTTCAQGQQGDVWYLPQTLTGVDAVRPCTIPVGTATVVNMVGVLEDYPCPDPSFHPAAGQSLEDFLTQVAVQTLGSGMLDVRLDGQPVPDPLAYRYVTPMFTFTEAPSMSAVDPCGTGSPQPGVAAGYTLMLHPLPIGEHVLRVYASDPPDHLLVTYHITVTA